MDELSDSIKALIREHVSRVLKELNEAHRVEHAVPCVTASTGPGPSRVTIPAGHYIVVNAVQWPECEVVYLRSVPDGEEYPGVVSKTASGYTPIGEALFARG